MMRRLFLILTGILLMAQPLEASAQSLYQQILDRVRSEWTLGTAEKSVKEFVKNVFKGKGVTLTNEDIDAALGATNKNILCGQKGATPQTRPGCEKDSNTIRITAMAEAQVRMLGRDLQAIAAGYEFPIEGEPGRFLDLPIQYNAIISIWRTGTGVTATGSTGIRTYFLEEKLAEEPLNNLGKTLKSLTEEELTAAVWRYRHGYQFVRREHEPPAVPTVPFHAEGSLDDKSNGLNTERQYLFKRWDGTQKTQNIEKLLEEIWNILPRDPLAFDPPLKEQEVVLFVFPQKILERTLPQNILVWARIDGSAFKKTPGGKDYDRYGYSWGDVGLQWHIPIDPVLPSLIGLTSGEPIRGGQYPPNPIGESQKPLDGLGLCVHPIGRQGYLCRTRLRGADCQEEVEPEPDTIILARCSEKEKLPSTDLQEEGEQLVCPGIPWNDEEENKKKNREESTTICQPQNYVSYRNTIGNTMCYIGQCIEESMRTHRLVSGRNTFITQGAAYPWDPLMKSTTGGQLLTPPPTAFGSFPPYRPQRILNAFDTALCQSVGLPPRTPPALCMFNELRSLAFPVDFLTTANRLLVQTGEQFEPFFGLRNLAMSIGTRISTELYVQYLQTTTKPLAELIKSATTILQEIQKTTFPTEMCPTQFDPSQLQP